VKLSARTLLLGVLVAGATATCVRLGFWQLARMRYKHTLHAAQRALLAEPPIEVTSTLPDLPPETGRRVHVHGHPDATAKVLLSGRTHMGAAGVSLVVAVRLASGECVLVELGWMPADDGRTALTPEFHPEQPLDAIGVALPLERSPHPTRWAELRSQWPRTRLWSARVLERDSVVARFAPPVADWYVRALPVPDSGDVHPSINPEPYIIPDESMHLSYAIQWFGFATIIGLGSLALALRRRPVKG
jgi:surfeit locus 1 family protein